MLIYNLSLKQNYVVLESQAATFIEFLLCVNCFVARKDVVLWPLTLWNFQSIAQGRCAQMISTEASVYHWY